jgi:hypothetical protein
VSFSQKLFWTVVALLVYLVCSQMPLYGIASAKSADPFYIMRMILASSRCVGFPGCPSFFFFFTPPHYFLAPLD